MIDGDRIVVADPLAGPGEEPAKAEWIRIHDVWASIADESWSPSPFSRALARYWGAKSQAKESQAYAEVLSLGGEPAYGESREEMAALVARFGLTLPECDIASVTRDIARGG